MSAVAEWTIRRRTAATEGERLFAAQVKLISLVIENLHRPVDEERTVGATVDGYVGHAWNPALG